MPVAKGVLEGYSGAMAAILTFLFIIALSLLILRIGTIALIMTGLSEEVASFQALSAYTGTGFTTQETEKVVNHPVRRRILRDLMILGNFGFVSATASAILSVATLQDQEAGQRALFILLGGMTLLVGLAMNPRSKRLISGIISRSLAWLTDLDLKDYADLLQIEGGYSVAEILVEPNEWISGKSLLELRLSDEGIWVLGIRRASGKYLGVPRPSTKMHPGDTLVVYGRRSRLEELSERPAGEAGQKAHVDAVDRLHVRFRQKAPAHEVQAHERDLRGRPNDPLDDEDDDEDAG